jgi:HlyD family secretion protein
MVAASSTDGSRANRSLFHRGSALLAVALATALCGCGPKGDRPVQGYVEGEYARVAAPFAGALTQLSVKRGDQVSAGAPLFALEKENEVAARRQAEQQLEGAQARLQNLRTGKRASEVETVEEQLRQAMATRDLAVANLGRQQKLYSEKFVSAAVIDDARMQVKRSNASVDELKAAVATAQLPARSEEIRAAEADARAAREILAQADWRLGQRAIASPVTGRVNDTYYVKGDWVPAGLPVASILPPANVKFRFFVPEPVLGRLKPGQAVTVSCDGCGAPMNATIDFISDRAEFTPPVLYSRDNRAKLVFLVEARPPPDRAAGLNPGQPVDVMFPQ